MSRVGRKKIVVPSGVTVAVANGQVRVKGPKGEQAVSLRPEITATVSGQEVTVALAQKGDGAADAFTKSLHGLLRNEIYNAIVGTSAGYEKVLEINGVGYRAAVTGRKLTLSLGFSHPVEFELPKGIDASVEKQTVLTIKGSDKQLVGQVAATIRGFREPEPYKGKGIKYKDEHIIRKEGKAGKK